MMSDSDNLKVRVLCLEKEMEKLQECILQLEVKLKVNPYTRDTFRNRGEVFFEEL
jgi:hypothetical protein